MKWEDFLSLSGNSPAREKCNNNRQKIFCALPPPLFNITNILSDLLLFFISHHWPLHSKMPKEIFKKKKKFNFLQHSGNRAPFLYIFFSTNHPVCLLPVWAIIPRSSLLSSFHCCNPRPFSQERRKEIKEGKRRVAALQLFFPLSRRRGQRLSSLAAAALKSWKGKRVVLEDLLFRCCHEDREEREKEEKWKEIGHKKKNFWKRKCNHQPSDGCFPEEMLAPISSFSLGLCSSVKKEKARVSP